MTPEEEETLWDSVLEEIELHHDLYGCGDPECERCQIPDVDLFG